MIRYEIGIVETRNVIKSILDTYGYDFRDYALTSFKRRLEQVIMNNGFKDADGLISRLSGNKDYFDLFLQEITPETTEMFRDPSLWRTIRDEILPDLMKGGPSKPKLWVSAFDSGEELYSLAIILKEAGLLPEVQLYTSAISDKVIDKIKSGRIDAKELEVNEANYLRFIGKRNFSDYYKNENGQTILDTSLIHGVNFIKLNTVYDSAPGGIKLILFRNQMIYYNQILQDKVMYQLSNSVVPGGYLAIGVKETLENTNTSNKFTVFNDLDKIYKKKTT
ncbi:MAG: protein-glutamate O-methyltransferase CheR [Bacteroidales bacterium]|nr:MAG: protein-glutamate O-methyltransferase CheR [Bacteroidales bacterium]